MHRQRSVEVEQHTHLAARKLEMVSYFKRPFFQGRETLSKRTPAVQYTSSVVTEEPPLNDGRSLRGGVKTLELGHKYEPSGRSFRLCILQYTLSRTIPEVQCSLRKLH